MSIQLQERINYMVFSVFEYKNGRLHNTIGLVILYIVNTDYYSILLKCEELIYIQTSFLSTIFNAKALNATPLFFTSGSLSQNTTLCTYRTIRLKDLFLRVQFEI